MAGAKRFVDVKIGQRKVLLFCKSYVPACTRVKKLLEPLNLDSNTYEIVYIEKRQDVVQIENYFQVLCLSDSREVPQLFIGGKYFGGPEKIFYWHKLGKLAEKIYEAMEAIEEFTEYSIFEELKAKSAIEESATGTHWMNRKSIL